MLPTDEKDRHGRDEDKFFKMKQEHLSKKYTTDWKNIIRVKSEWKRLIENQQLFSVNMFHCNSSPANGSPCFSDNFAGNLCYLWSDPSYYTVRLHSPDSNRFNFVFGDFLQIAQRNKGKLCRIIKIISKAVFIKNRNRKGIYVQYTLVICINQRRFFQKRQIVSVSCFSMVNPSFVSVK